MRIVEVLLSACVLLAAAPSVRAQRGGSADTAAQMFQSQDRDGDGFLARAEWRGAGASFLRADADRDGYLTLEELVASMDRRKSARSAPGRSQSPDDPAVAIGRFDAEPPDFVRATCTACHDLVRVLDLAMDSGGWAPLVERMRGKEGADFDAKTGERIVRFLSEQRSAALERQRASGSTDPRGEWAAVLALVPLGPFDRDQSGDLSVAELARAVTAAVDFDEDGEIDLGEFQLLPSAEDRAAEFRRLDQNKNGRLSNKEFSLPGSLIAELDRDGDGKLSPEERPRQRPGPMPLLLLADVDRVLEVADRDGDESLSVRELGRNRELIDRFDRDRDGRLSRAELEEALGQSRNALLDAMWDEFLRRFDLDGDGEVRRAEYPGPDGAFQRFDRDGNGVVTAKDAPKDWRPVADSEDGDRWRLRR